MIIYIIIYMYMCISMYFISFVHPTSKTKERFILKLF